MWSPTVISNRLTAPLGRFFGENTVPRHKRHGLTVRLDPELGRRILRARVDLLDKLPFSRISISDTIRHLIAAGLESRYAKGTGMGDREPGVI